MALNFSRNGIYMDGDLSSSCISYFTIHNRTCHISLNLPYARGGVSKLKLHATVIMLYSVRISSYFAS